MKQVQILGTVSNKYNTSDGLKIAIGNGEHRIGSVAWCDGDYLIGGQQYSSRTPYVPSGDRDAYVEILINHSHPKGESPNATTPTTPRAPTTTNGETSSTPSCA